MANESDPVVVTSENVENAEALAEAQAELATANASVESLTADVTEANTARDSAVADLAKAIDELATANASLAELQADFDQKVDAAAAVKADELAEVKAAEIAARAGTEAAEVSDQVDSDDDSKFKSMTKEQLWEHAAQLEDADQKRAFYIEHIRPR